MKPISLNDFRSEIQLWSDKISREYSDKALPFFSSGGWEGWLQVELAMHLTLQGYDVVRELKVYGTGQKADMVLNDNCSDSIHPRIVVEIKCQSVNTTDIDSVSGLISKDIDKLSGLPNDYVKLMLVAAVDLNFAEYLAGSGFKPCATVRDAIALFVRRV